MKQRRSNRMKWAKRVTFGVIGAGALFGAGYLAAKAPRDNTVANERLQVPEGYAVDRIVLVPVGAGVRWQLHAKDAAGNVHILWYKQGIGDQKAILHTTAVKVPAELAFEE